MFVGKF